jgi:hypothetical protein
MGKMIELVVASIADGKMTLRKKSGDEQGFFVDLQNLALCDTLSDDPGATGNFNSSGSTNAYNKEKEKEKAPSLNTDAVKNVWDFYLTTFNSRRRLDDKRRRVIRNALVLRRDLEGRTGGVEVRTLMAQQDLKTAILGLSRSPFHNGDNEQKKKYLEIRYALKGLGDESDDERIDKMIANATIVVELSASEKIKLAAIRYATEKNLRSGSEFATAREAVLYFRGKGYEVVRLPQAPWAQLKQQQ